MKVYLSSTFNDLMEHREHAYHAMRGLGLEVVAMEDYVARDERPVDRCLTDVASSDLYVGLFAFRYGYVPPQDNDLHRSVTELEYRQAIEHKVPRLLFMARPDTWNVSHVDAFTGDGEQGARIEQLRAEISLERMRREFTTPDQLEAEVIKGVSVWLFEHNVTPASSSRQARPVLPHPRQLQHDVLLLHASADAATAAAIAGAVSPVWSVQVSATGLTAATVGDLRALDHLAASSRSVAVLLSDSSLTVLAEDRTRSERVLGLARDRTGTLLGLPVRPIPAGSAATWGLTEVLKPPAAGGSDEIADLGTALHQALARHQVSGPHGIEVGLPVLVVAMTQDEATDLLADPPAPVAELVSHAQQAGQWQADRYGTSRSHWRPFGSQDSIEQVLNAAVTAVNEKSGRLHRQIITLQPYPLDPLMRDSLLMWPIYRDIARTGCLVIIDELSLFHKPVREALINSPMPAGEQVALVTLCAGNPVAGTPYALVRDELNGYLQGAARRFGVGLDPLCELGVPERHRLDRWLSASLPQATDLLQHVTRDDDRLSQFEQELGATANPALTRLIAGEVTR